MKICIPILGHEMNPVVSPGGCETLGKRLVEAQIIFERQMFTNRIKNIRFTVRFVYVIRFVSFRKQLTFCINKTMLKEATNYFY